MDQSQILDRLPDPLAEEEQAELFKKYYETKDEEYRNMLVSHNLKLAASVVQKYYKSANMEFEDLFQIACLELVNVVEKYNPELGYSFSTFAVTSIKNRLSRPVSKAGSEINLGSLDEPVRDELGNEHDELRLLDILSDKDESSIEEDYLIKEKIINICNWVNKNCTPQEIYIFEATSGIKSTPIKKCADIAKELNLSLQRVYEIRGLVRSKIRRKFFHEQENQKEKQ